MGSNTFDWNSPQFQNSSYFKWVNEGDSIEGVITGMSSTTFPAKGELGMADYQAPQTYPVLNIDTATGELELTVSNVDLLQKTRVKNPQVGDWYSAAWVATAGKKRIFLVVVKKGPDDMLAAASTTVRDMPQAPRNIMAEQIAAGIQPNQTEVPF